MSVSKPAYADRIVHDPDIMLGKPTVGGTRITVEAVLAHLAANPDPADLFASYPRLTTDDLKAALAYAEERVRRHGAGAQPDIDVAGGATARLSWRFLLDERANYQVAPRRRRLGHDVIAVGQNYPASSQGYRRPHHRTTRPTNRHHE